MTAQQQVDASTVSAAGLFSNNRFSIPDFQRNYSWRVDYEVSDFWQDLSGAIDDTDDYFLGLLILTDDKTRREVVDGQQRLVTVSLLANALRLAAVALDRKLVADTLRSAFLFSIDYQTEMQVQRLTLTDEDDSKDFADAVGAATQQLVPAVGRSQIIPAYRFLVAKLQEDLESSGKPELRVGQWAEFLTEGLKFTVFAHPDRAAAFRVFEVVNTRGKILTPAELIKSYLIGSSLDSNRSATFERWRSIEQQFDDVAAVEQITTFVRHVVELRRGYVVPRELYQVVTRVFKGPSGVDELLSDLEKYLPVYIQMIDPSVDVESSEVRTRVFNVLMWLSANRFRPLFLAAVEAGDDKLLQRALDIVVPGILGGTFGSGSIEAQFARAARRVHQHEASWDSTLDALDELCLPREDFVLRMKRNLNKSHAQVVRAAITQDTTLPAMSGYVHQVRPRNGEGWSDFGDDDYKELGSSLANWMLVAMERRPQGSRSPDAVKEKLIPYAVQDELIEETDIDSWTADYARSLNNKLSEKCGVLWYGA